MIEVEAKVKISNPASYKKAISKLAKYVGKEKKVDDYFTLLPLDSYPTKSLRVRKRSNFYEVNYKESLSYKERIHAKNEVEFQVSDIDNFLSLLKNFGFKRWLRKEKTTYLYKIKNNLHIELNQVKKLGWFIEIEYLTKNNEEEIKKNRKEVTKVLESLGFTKIDIIKSGYTKLLWNKK